MDKIKLYYSKKEKDLMFKYPDRAGRSLMGIFFDLVKTTGHRMDWEQDLRTILEERGYDYESLVITVKKRSPNQKTINNNEDTSRIY